MPPLIKAHGEDFPGSTGFNGEEDTTHAQGEEDFGTTAFSGEEDEIAAASDETNPFGAY